MVFIVEGLAMWLQSELAMAVTQASDVSSFTLGGDSGGGETWMCL